MSDVGDRKPSIAQIHNDLTVRCSGLGLQRCGPLSQLPRVGDALSQRPKVNADVDGISVARLASHRRDEIAHLLLGLMEDTHLRDSDAIDVQFPTMSPGASNSGKRPHCSHPSQAHFS